MARFQVFLDNERLTINSSAATGEHTGKVLPPTMIQVEADGAYTSHDGDLTFLQNQKGDNVTVAGFARGKYTHWVRL